MIRVANVIEEGRVGGPQLRLIRVAAAQTRDVRTLVVMPRANSKLFERLCAERSIDNYQLPLSQITKGWRAMLWYLVGWPTEIARLVLFLRRQGVDLVHVAGGSWQVKGVIAASLARIPAVWHLNDAKMPRFILVLFRLMNPLATGFIYTSQRVVEYYNPLIRKPRPYAVIPPPVSTEAFDPNQRYPDTGMRRGGSAERLLVGTVCNVNPVKGLETLIEAGGILAGEGRSIDIVVVGPVFESQRSYKRSLVRLAGEVGVSTVQFVGRAEDVRPYLSEFDVYVCSSISESWGMSAWEAMAMECAVVSTDVGDLGRNVVDGRDAFIVPVRDAEGMARRIAQLDDDPELRSRMGERARNRAEKFAPSMIAMYTREFYWTVLSGYRRK